MYCEVYCLQYIVHTKTSNVCLRSRDGHCFLINVNFRVKERRSGKRERLGTKWIVQRNRKIINFFKTTKKTSDFLNHLNELEKTSNGLVTE